MTDPLPTWPFPAGPGDASVVGPNGQYRVRMAGDSPLLRTYGELTTRVMLTVGGAFEASNSKNASPVGRARRVWSEVPDLLETIHDALAVLGQDVFTVVTNVQVNEVGRNQAMQRITTAARRDIDAATTDVLQRCATITGELRAAAFPARPAGTRLEQEAILAGIKTDLRMVLDGCPTGLDLRDGGVLQHLVDHLRRAIGDGDQLRTWLLASSDWPREYLTSRGVAGQRQLWDGYVAEVLNDATPAELADVRTVYRKVTSGQTGLPVLIVLFNSTLPVLFDQITSWGVSSPVPGPPAPPVRTPARRTTYLR